MIKTKLYSCLCLTMALSLFAANAMSQAQMAGNTESSDQIVAALDIQTSGLVGVAGVAARDMASGKQVFLNADQPFPMASTYKIPIAIALLSKIDAGELSLTDMIEIDDDEWVYSQVIAANFIHAGVALSVANLLEVMITHSDNTATDVCLRLVGGPAEVNRRLAELGVEGISVDRSTADLLRDFYGIEAGRQNLAEIGRIARADPGRVITADAQFEADLLDKSTPRAMLYLLTKLFEGGALSDKSTEFLLGVMARTKTMPDRLGGLLPSHTPIAHKTGTVGGVVNDVGYITLPDGRRFAIAVFTRGSDTPPAARERAIAEVARILYDYFLIHPANG